MCRGVLQLLAWVCAHQTILRAGLSPADARKTVRHARDFVGNTGGPGDVCPCRRGAGASTSGVAGPDTPVPPAALAGRLWQLDNNGVCRRDAWLPVAQMFMYYAKAQTLAGSTPTFSRIATSNTTMTHGGFLMFLKEAGIVPHVLPKAEALKLLVGAPREVR